MVVNEAWCPCICLLVPVCDWRCEGGLCLCLCLCVIVCVTVRVRLDVRGVSFFCRLACSFQENDVSEEDIAKLWDICGAVVRMET